MRRPACLTVAVLVLLASRVAADPAPAEVPSDKTFIVWDNPIKLCVPSLIECITVAPGYYLAQPKFSQLDLRIKTAEDQVTRLTAENTSLRKSSGEIPWLPIAVGIGVGLVLGTYVGLKF